MAERQPSKSRGLPLTFRLLVVLLVGSLFLGFVVTQLAQGHDRNRRVREQDDRVRKLAASLATRAAPLLAARDDLRLAMLSASAAELGSYRVLMLDQDGLVVFDTGLALGGKKLQVLTAGGAFRRRLGPGLEEHLAPALGLRGRVGEVRVRYEELRFAGAAFSWLLFGGTLLACLTLVVLACLVSHHWMLHVREATETVQGLARGELSARWRRRTGGVLQALQASLQDLGQSLTHGDNQARSSLVELGCQLVEVLERRGRHGHGERACRYAMVLAQRLGLTTEETHDLELAARLHDLGEAWLRPSLLDKDGPLNEQERDCLRSLPDRGASVLSRLPSMRRVAETIRHHREKFDGSGYPDGLRGERIPLGARILAIADAYDQLTCCKTYGHPVSWPDALDRLYEDRGEHFDPWLVDLFEEEIRKAPMPEDPKRQVMISPAGVLPYKAMEDEWLIDRIPEDEDGDVDEWGDVELDVLDEDAVEEDKG